MCKEGNFRSETVRLGGNGINHSALCGCQAIVFITRSGLDGKSQAVIHVNLGILLYEVLFVGPLILSIHHHEL